MSEDKLRRRVLFDNTVPIDVPLTRIDLGAIRRVFSDLFDHAALAVQRAGHDQDDSVVERFLVCRAGNANDQEIAAECLSDAGRLATHIVGTLIAAGVAESAARNAHIAGLKVVAILETLT